MNLNLELDSPVYAQHGDGAGVAHRGVAVPTLSVHSAGNFIPRNRILFDKNYLWVTLFG